MCEDRLSHWLNEVRIIDGGFGYEAVRRSTYPIEGHKAWSCRLLKDDPSLVVDIHKSYLRAGCDIVTTNTYQAAPETLAEALNVEVVEAVEFMKKAVHLAKRAIDEFMKEEYESAVVGNFKSTRKLKPLIAGSLGPYGACQADCSEYTGAYICHIPIEEIYQFHLKRAKILLSAGVDFIAWETIPSSVEVSAISRVMQDLPDSALAWVTLATPDGQVTARGEPLHEVTQILGADKKIFGVGINCTVPHRAIRTALANISGIEFDRAIPNDDDYHPNTHQALKNSHCSGCPLRPKILIAYANSGERWAKKARSRRKGGGPSGFWIWPSDIGPADWASTMANVAVTREMAANEPGQTANQISHKLGLAQWIGGCCRVTPENILDLSMRIKPEEFSRLTPSTEESPHTSTISGASSSAQGEATIGASSRNSLKRTRSDHQTQAATKKQKRH